jgi:Domain of unknown function (DUF4287)
VSFQAYLDNIQEKTGITPNEFIAMAKEKGLIESRDILAWLKSDYDLGTGHARALDYVIRHGPTYTVRRKAGTPHVESGTLILDGSSLTRRAKG